MQLELGGEDAVHTTSIQHLHQYHQCSRLMKASPPAGCGRRRTPPPLKRRGLPAPVLVKHIDTPSSATMCVAEATAEERTTMRLSGRPRWYKPDTGLAARM